MRPKTKLLAVKFRRIFEVLCLQVLQKRFWAHYHDFCVQKRSCLPWGSDRFWKFSSCKLYEKVLGAISRIMRPKRNCLPWCSDAFWNFSACKIYIKSNGWNVTIYVSKNEAVCCEVETHFGSFIRASFIKHFWAHFHVFCVHNRSCLQWNSDAFWKFSASRVYGESFVRIFTIFAPQNEGVCFEVHTHFGTSLLVRFTEIVMGALSRFMRPKTKPFAAKFRRTLEVLRMQGLQKKVSWHS